jgi:carboxyl-terminal processing protease
MTGRARHGLRLTATLLALAAFFVFGFMAGRVGRHSGESVLDEAAARISADAAGAVDRLTLEKAAITGMLSALGDRYATYYGRAEYADLERLLEGRYTGLGVWLARVRQRVQVTSVVPGSPAADAGLRSGDEILAVDGHRTAAGSVASVVSAMRGSSGTQATVEIRRAGVVRRLVLLRSEVVTSDVLVDRPATDVVRIRVAAFTRGVGRQVRDAVAQANSDRLPGIIVDLRGNPGGLLHEAVEAASAFLGNGVVVTYRGPGVQDEVYDVVSPGDTTTSVAVLVDTGTASAAEVVAGALQDRDRAVVVGSRTYGKGSVQQPVRLSDGTAIEFTIARYFTPSGRALDGVGVRPDIEVAPNASDEVALRRAVGVVGGVMAGAGHPKG